MTYTLHHEILGDLVGALRETGVTREDLAEADLRDWAMDKLEAILADPASGVSLRTTATCDCCGEDLVIENGEADLVLGCGCVTADTSRWTDDQPDESDLLDLEAA